MSKEDTDLIEELETVEIEKLDFITVDEMKAERPKIFGDESFSFAINDISKARVIRNVKTRVGVGNMYILDTNPRIYTFGNAWEQLQNFYAENKLKSGSIVKYIEKYIPEGKDSFSTTYKFEVIEK